MDYSEYQKGTEKVLQESQQEKTKYFVELLGKTFVVYPNVFSPKYFFDTEFFAKAIPFTAGDEFLEIGQGTGVISVVAALNGAKRVVAIDINPEAVKNTVENVQLHDVENIVTVMQGDVYFPLAAGDMFSTIFWNTPFGHVEKSALSMLERSVFDPHYEVTTSFIVGAKKHLKPGGRLLIGFSTVLGKFEEIEKILQAEGYIVKLLSQVESTETHPVTFELFEATLRYA